MVWFLHPLGIHPSSRALEQHDSLRIHAQQLKLVTTQERRNQQKYKFFEIFKSLVEMEQPQAYTIHPPLSHPGDPMRVS
jgi:hypothetical protein